MSDRELIEAMRSSAKAFRKHPIYTSDGDPVLLTVQADECDAAADRLEAQAAEIEGLREALEPFVSGYEHTSIFLRTREKMHEAGRDLYRDEVDRARQALQQGQNDE